MIRANREPAGQSGQRFVTLFTGLSSSSSGVY